MEYGTVIDKKQRYVNKVGGLKNDNHNRYVLYEATESTFENVLFSEKNLQYIGDKVSEKMACLGRPVILTMKTISSAVSTVLNTYQPQLGDIFSIYQIPAEKCRNDIWTINEQSIELIYKQLKTEFEIDENNKKLTVWTTILGDFNEHGLRQYSTLRLNHKPINKLRFNMNY